jgi:hypothetical protein
MLNVIDCNEKYYTYEELRYLFLKKEIQQGVFATFHPQPHKNLQKHSIEKIRDLYAKSIDDENCVKQLLMPDIQYTDAKTFKQVWNEFVRDYTEFFAFIGLLPTYYKGVGGNSGEKKHYVTNLVKQFQNNEISIEELILMFKFRNTSKDYDNLDMYHIEVRPFVLAIKALNYYKSNGYTFVNPHIISAIVCHCRNEFDSFIEVISVFPNPNKDLIEYKDNFDRLTKEIERVTLLLKPYLEHIGVVEVVKKGNKNQYKILDKVNEIKYPLNCVFCDGHIGKYKLTPLIGKVLRICNQYANSPILPNDLFDVHFSEDDKNSIIQEFINLGIFTSCQNNIIQLNSIENQYFINPYSDFMSIDDAEYVDSFNEIILNETSQSIIVEYDVLAQEILELKNAALSSNGADYEQKLFGFIDNRLSIFTNKNWYGTATTGQRLSDIACIANVYTNSETRKILIIIECKASNAIRSFDERKERDDIINTLKKYKDENFDGVWYWIADSRALPDFDIHGGYRNSSNNYSLIEKLNILQFDISEETRRPSIVTAFSIDALIVYLKYLYQNTKNLTSTDKITESTVPHFWRWSKKFMNVQYITIHKDLTL